VVTSPVGVGPEYDCAGEDQQQLQTIDAPSRKRGCYIITASVQFKIKYWSRVTRGLSPKTDWR
jgi:hypothetical protein